MNKRTHNKIQNNEVRLNINKKNISQVDTPIWHLVHKNIFAPVNKHISSQMSSETGTEIDKKTNNMSDIFWKIQETIGVHFRD